MPQDQATLAVASQDATTVTFAAEFTGHKNQNANLIWVSCKTEDADGATASVQYLPVHWDVPFGENPGPGSIGTAGPFAFEIGATPNPDAGPVASLEAFASHYPDIWTPVSNTVTLP